MKISPAKPKVSIPLDKRSIINKTTHATTFGTQQDAPQALKPDDKHVMCELIGDVTLTFNNHPERLRAKGKILPKRLYRTAYENSATLSQFVTPDCLVKHRDVPHLKLHDGNAFQNVGDFVPTQDMTRLRIERQFKYQMKIEPSPFVSMYDSLKEAAKRASTQYNQSRLVGHRVYIAEIDTAGLIPATLHGEEQLSETYYVHNTLTVVSNSVDTRRVSVPVWVGSAARPADGSAITIQQFLDSHAGMYVSVAELRLSDLVVRGSAKRDTEWLSCGPILMSRIKRVMPYDGKIVHAEKGNNIVQSRQSIETYIFDWSESKWRHNPDTRDMSKFRNELIGDKRKRSEEEENVENVLRILRSHMLRALDDDATLNNSESPASRESESPEPRESESPTSLGFDF